MKNRFANMVIAAMAASVICISTLFLQVPSPFKGYLHMGDGAVLLIGWLLPTHYALLSAGVGAALADFLSGYTVYLPATFVIKATMAYIVCAIQKRFSQRFSLKTVHLLSGIIAELLMMFGYWVYESFLFGCSLATLNLPGNLLQAGLGVASAVMLERILGVGKTVLLPK